MGWLMCMNGPSGWSTILPMDVPPVSVDVTVTDVAETEAETDVVDLTRVRVKVVTTSNKAVFIEFRVRLDTVEAWVWDRLAAVFDRERLRSWLAVPSGWLAEGEVVLSVDPRFEGDQIAIALTDVLTWTLSAEELRELRERV